MDLAASIQKSPNRRVAYARTQVNQRAKFLPCGGVALIVTSQWRFLLRERIFDYI